MIQTFRQGIEQSKEKPMQYWKLLSVLVSNISLIFIDIFIKGDRKMWFSTSTSYSGTKGNWYCVCSCPQETASDGWYRGLLYLSTRTDCHFGKFWYLILNLSKSCIWNVCLRSILVVNLCQSFSELDVMPGPKQKLIVSSLGQIGLLNF